MTTEATVSERLEGSRVYGTGRDAGVEIKYNIFDAADETEALTALEEEAPSTWEGYTLLGLRVEPNDEDTTWIGTARYGPLSGASSNKTREVGDTWSGFDTGGETEHITTNVALVSSYPAGTAVENKGAIGDDGENVAGVDIPVAAYNFTVTKIFDGTSIGATQKGALYALTGKTNASSVTLDGVSFNAREVLFLGATASQRLKEGGGSVYEITFRFSAKPNRTGLSVGSITGIAKKGWEYLDVRYSTTYDSDAKRLYQNPVAVHIHQVFQDGDFGGFATYFGI